MSEPAIFTLIRDGKRRHYADRWASATLRREVMWGPVDFEAWVEQFEQLDEWDDCCSGGAVVDYDNHLLLWSGDISSFQAPRMWRTYCQLMTAAWPNFQVKFADNGTDQFADYLGIPLSQEAADEGEDDNDNEEYEHRPPTVVEARRDDPDDQEASDVDPNDESLRAWITLIDDDGNARQRQLSELTLDLLRGESPAINALTALPPAEIPKEAYVSEGLLLNPTKRTARIWGSSELLNRMKQYGKLWKGWQLKWTHHGYADQCAASGTKGLPMSDIDALAKILPLILSTEQLNLGAVMDALGDGVKKFAEKTTGCLTFLICIPLVLFGAFSGNWTAVAYSVGATIFVISALFILVTRRFRNAVKKNIPQNDPDEESTVVAGPLEEDARRARVNQLLLRADLPSLDEVEPHFKAVSGLELLAS
ncbi:MAG: hypothetical protein AAGD11_02820 [Planctomycetota bacterium]